MKKMDQTPKKEEIYYHRNGRFDNVMYMYVNTGIHVHCVYMYTCNCVV